MISTRAMRQTTSVAYVVVVGVVAYRRRTLRRSDVDIAAAADDIDRGSSSTSFLRVGLFVLPPPFSIPRTFCLEEGVASRYLSCCCLY